MELILDNSYTDIIFTAEEEQWLKPIVEEEMHYKLGVKEEGYIFSPAYKSGHWDGIRDFYEKKEQRFPTGLMGKVEEILGELQNTHRFTYSVFDNRPDVFIDPGDLPEEIKLLDNEIGEITLRDYQYGAFESVFSRRMSVIHMGTGGGKCVHPDTQLLTSKGLMTVRELFEEEGHELSNVERVVPYKGDTYLINRYGEYEKPSHLTFNGEREIKHITTDYGNELEVTENHPLLTATKDGNFVWKNAGDFNVGDWVIGRKGTEVFGETEGITKEDAYALGLLIADGYIAQKDKIDFDNDQEELLRYMEGYFKKKWKHVAHQDDSRSGNKTVSVYGRDLISEFMSNFEMTHSKSAGKEVPKSILRASREIQVAFLSGYLECEMFIGTKEKLYAEVTTASRTLAKQVHQMLLNMGVHSRLRLKRVEGYEDNYYGRITTNQTETAKLLDMLEFITEERTSTKTLYHSKFYRKETRLSQDIVPFGKELVKEYIDTYIGDAKGMRTKYKVPKNVSLNRMGKLLDEYPYGEATIKDKIEDLVSGDYLFHRVVSIEDKEPTSTFDFHMPETHSFIAEGIVNHNTEVASGIIKQTLPEMESKETIAFFTMSKEIFNQTADRLEERLGMPIGRYGAGKKDIKKVNVVMVPTIAAALKIDPEKGVKLTAKERIVKKMAKDIAPKYLKGVNQKQLLRAFIQNFEVKTKADENFLAEIDELIYTSESDAKIKFKLNAYKVKYEEIIEKKNKKKLKKKKDVQDFLDSIVMFISDEHQHISSDSLYNTLLACNNAIYRIGLSGSIDDKDKMLLQRMESVTGLPSARVTSSYLIGEGHLAKPTIIMTPIYGVEQGRETVNISGLKDYMAVYEHGIVKNEYRNKLIAKITEMCYHKDEGVLIIVNRIEHGETVSRLLDLLNVPHEFLQGEVEDDIRQEKLQAMREGHLKVMIATSIMDEGVDISGIDTLIMAAGGKSLRQTIQRVGRAIRKKKGKENTASVYDFEDRTHDYLFRHAKERRKIYEAEEFDVNYIE